MILLTAPLAASAAPCVRESLVEFRSGGSVVASERIGSTDQDEISCRFGGNKALTPKYKIIVFVNFNIPGVVDLDAIDTSFERNAAGRRHGNRLLDPRFDFSISFVKHSFFNQMGYDTTLDTKLSARGNTLFISEKGIDVDRLPKIWDEYFGQEVLWLAPPSAPPAAPRRFRKKSPIVEVSVPRFS